MFTNYFLVAFRNAKRHKLFTFINVFGLAFSLSFCLFVIMLIADQTSFDNFHPRADDVYRVLTTAQRKNGDTEPYASSPYPLGEIIAAESPAVDNIVHVVRGLSADAELGGNKISLEGYFTGPSFFDVFGFTLENGNAQEALVRPHTMILTRETAQKIFGKGEAVGRTVTLTGLGDFVVTGIIAPKPGKSHIEFDALASTATLPVLEHEGKIPPITTDWKNYYSNSTYVRLAPQHSPAELGSLLASIQDRFYGNLSLESRDKGYSFELQPLLRISPGPLLSQSMGRALPMIILYFLSGLAFIGMVAALFNYTNLTLARSLARAREIGLRKVVGANRKQLITQLLSESVFTALVSLLLAIVLVQTVLVPGFQSLQIAEGSDITLTITPFLLLWFALFATGAGLIAGILPSLVMSGFRPAAVLKDVSQIRVFSGLTLRKVLLAVQFILSITIFIVITVMQRQVAHSLTMNYGFDWHNTLTIRLQGQDANRVAQQFQQQQNVKAVTIMSHRPLTWEDWTEDVRTNPADNPVGVRVYSVDERFVGFFGLDLVAGENFHKDLPVSNQRLVLVNEKFVETFKLGMPREAVGRQIILGDSSEVRIAGVLKNFFYKPATYALAPLVLTYLPENWAMLAVKVGPGDLTQTRLDLESMWKKLDPYHSFEGKMYSDVLNDVYDFFSETVTIVGFLGFLAFGISLLGLLGIVTFQVERRAKEIGIRKVLGAGTRDLLMLLARREALLLLVATAIAIPIGLFLSSTFLEQFAQQIELGISSVLPAVFVVYMCAGITIVVQAIRAVVTNPVETLKYE